MSVGTVLLLAWLIPGPAMRYTWPILLLGLAEDDDDRARIRATSHWVWIFVGAIWPLALAVYTIGFYVGGIGSAIQSVRDARRGIVHLDAEFEEEPAPRNWERNGEGNHARILYLASVQSAVFRVGQLVREPHGECGRIDTIFADYQSVLDGFAVKPGWYEGLEKRPKTPKGLPFYSVVLPRGSVIVGELDLEPAEEPT